MMDKFECRVSHFLFADWRGKVFIGNEEATPTLHLLVWGVNLQLGYIIIDGYYYEKYI